MRSPSWPGTSSTSATTSSAPSTPFRRLRPSRTPALKSFLEGVIMTERELLNVLERHGIRRVLPMHEPFNPHLHQAVMEIQRSDVPSGTIVQVFQAGLHDRGSRAAPGDGGGGEGRTQGGARTRRLPARQRCRRPARAEPDRAQPAACVPAASAAIFGRASRQNSGRLRTGDAVLRQQDEERHALDPHAVSLLLQAGHGIQAVGARERDLHRHPARARLRPLSPSAPRHAADVEAFLEVAAEQPLHDARPGAPAGRLPRSGGARGACWACAACDRRRTRSRVRARCCAICTSSSALRASPNLRAR